MKTIKKIKRSKKISNIFCKLEDFIKTNLDTENKQSLLMSVLHKVQELFGYIPRDAIDFVSERLSVPSAHIYGMVTFYNHFSLRPKAKFEICVCKGTACYVAGGARILSKIKEELGIEEGEVTKDGLFGIGITRCLGCCGLSPVMQINDEVFVRMVPEKVPEILKRYRRKKK